MPKLGANVPKLSTNVPKPGVNVEPVYLGIDPGVNGGIVALQREKVVQIRMPDTPEKVWYAFVDWVFEVGPSTYAVLEHVPHSIFGTAKSSSSKLYGSFKALEMALVAGMIPHTLVTAKVWQAEIGIDKRKKGETTAHWKGRLRQRAKQLFPLRNIPLETSDALLIAEYCRRLNTDTLGKG